MKKCIVMLCTSIVLATMQARDSKAPTEQPAPARVSVVQCSRLEVVNDAGKVVVSCSVDPKTKAGRIDLFDANGKALPSPGSVLVPATDTPTVVESKIDGDFEELDMDKVYKLVNGQIWQQTSAHIEYHFKFMPDVLIYKSGATWKMLVEGCRDAVTVERLK